MIRRFVSYFVLLTALSLLAQQPLSPTELNRRIERQVRAYAEAPPDAKITLGTRSPSSFANYENLPVTIEANSIKKTFNFLLSKDGRKLLYVKEFDLSEDPYAKLMNKIDISGRPIRGAQDGRVTIVMYDDYQCPFCARFYITLFNEVMNKYRDQAKIVLKDFPISEIHPWALRAAVDSNCLAQSSSTAYWQFSDYLHTHQQEFNSKWKLENESNPAPQKPFVALDSFTIETGTRNKLDISKLQACIAEQNTMSVETSLAEGKSLGVSATPTVFINGEEFEGALSAMQIQAAIERALNESH